MIQFVCPALQTLLLKYLSGIIERAINYIQPLLYNFFFNLQYFLLCKIYLIWNFVRLITARACERISARNLSKYHQRNEGFGRCTWQAKHPMGESKKLWHWFSTAEIRKHYDLRCKIISSLRASAPKFMERCINKTSLW